jgi:Zn-finger nucleic acid-binding protein
MQESAQNGVVVDICPVCSSVWFDPAEIAACLSGKSAVDDADLAMSTCVASSSACPRCGDQQLVIGDLRDVSFERCLQCGGLFFTRQALGNLAQTGPGQRAGERFTLLDIVRGVKELLILGSGGGRRRAALLGSVFSDDEW